jgi:hypothetical protein
VSVFKESPRTHLHVRTPIAIGLVLVLVIALSAFCYYRRPAIAPSNPMSAPPDRAAAPPPPPKATAEPTAKPAPAPEPSAPARKSTPTRRVEAPKPAPPAATPTRASLTVESDVPGASVFVDRQFVGNAPITLDNVEPGSKRINLVADGFDGISKTVDVAAGPQTVSMRFKEVRLDARIPVTHKHGVGSCTGELVASVDGLRYVTSNAKDAGTVPFAALEQFDVNYLEKNLRVKQRGGRTWNFTDGKANADALFVFHRDVESARKKLSQGYAPVR